AEHLAQLPRPQQARRFVGPGSSLYALHLFGTLGQIDRAREVLGYVTEKLLPMLRSNVAEHLSVVEKLQLVECYLQKRQRLEVRPDLVEVWVPSQKLSRSVLQAEAATPPQLVRLGLLQENQLLLLQQFQRRELISAASYDDLKREAEELQRQTWQRVLRADATNVKARLGMVWGELRAGDKGKALTTLEQGLAACGPDPLLVAAKTRLLQGEDPAAGLAFLEKSLGEGPVALPLCRLLAE